MAAQLDRALLAETKTRSSMDVIRAKHLRNTRNCRSCYGNRACCFNGSSDRPTTGKIAIASGTAGDHVFDGAYAQNILEQGDLDMTTKKPELNAGIIGRRIEQIQIDQLRPYAANPRTHSKQQLNLIAWSIERFGFIKPILVDHNNLVIAGHGCVMAALKLGLSTVPALRIEHLDAAAKRVYMLADNRLAELAGWDRETLIIELQAVVDIYKNT
jgi:hypothetical protein